MVAGVELTLNLLGPLTLRRANEPMTLPASRKVRALIAYLALGERPYLRSHLCDLLWDSPGDPRGELRWCLSKVRGLLDLPGASCVRTSGERVSLDLSACRVDALEIAQVIQDGVQSVSIARLQELAALFAGDLLEGLELERSPQFSGWLVAQRRRFRACHEAILERLANILPAGSAEQLAAVEKWIALAPLDRRAHAMLFEAFASAGRLREGEEHLAAAVRQFDAEGLDCEPLRAAWTAATARRGSGSLAASRSVARARDANITALTPRSDDTGRSREDSVCGVDAAAGSAPRLIVVGASANAGSGAPRLVTVIDSEAANADLVTPARRASIAVMPLIDVSDAQERLGSLGNALVHDVITRLAKLRSLAVIAQGSVFALGQRGIGPGAAGRMLDVDYVASGSVRRYKQRVTVMIELVATRTAHIVWAEDFDYALDDALVILEEIGNRIVAAIASEIESAERKRALLKPPENLDAWEAYHRGLWHMYRFDAADNDLAQHFFKRSVQLDPTFSRAHAGLSFTHFQNAFLHRIADREREMDRALATAEQGLSADERDPAVHWALGRALWLNSRRDESLTALQRAVELSPNFALGHYALSFVLSQSGDPKLAIASADQSRHLSPFDPLLFAMMAARAMGLVRLGQAAEASKWALSAVGRPNAHVHVRAIAAHCLSAAERYDEAGQLVASIRKTHPGYGIQDFLSAFRFDPDSAEMFKTYARRIGLG